MEQASGSSVMEKHYSPRDRHLMCLVVCALRAAARVASGSRQTTRSSLEATACRLIAWQVEDGYQNVYRLWCTLRAMSLFKLRAHLTRGDMSATNEQLSTLEWAVVDTLLLYDTSVLTTTSFTQHAQVAALERTFQLVQQFQLQPENGGAVSPEQWSRAAEAYCKNGVVLSAVALQRRWHEIKLDTRQRACATRALLWPIHEAVAKRYPRVVTSTEATWRELVAAGKVTSPTSERGPAPGESRVTPARTHDLGKNIEASVSAIINAAHKRNKILNRHTSTSKNCDKNIDVTIKPEVIEIEDDVPSPKENIIDAIQDIDLSNVDAMIVYESDEEDVKTIINLEMGKGEEYEEPQNINSSVSYQKVQLENNEDDDDDSIEFKENEDNCQLEDIKIDIHEHNIKEELIERHKKNKCSSPDLNKQIENVMRTKNDSDNDIDSEIENSSMSKDFDEVENRLKGEVVTKHCEYINDTNQESSGIDPKLLMCPVVLLRRIDEPKIHNPPLPIRRQSTSNKPFETSYSRLSYERNEFINKPSSSRYRDYRARLAYEKNISRSFYETNKELLKQCKPCMVSLRRVDEEDKKMGGGRKRVRLPDMEIVRRNNRGIATAEVAPMMPIQDATKRVRPNQTYNDSAILPSTVFGPSASSTLQASGTNILHNTFRPSVPPPWARTPTQESEQTSLSENLLIRKTIQNSLHTESTQNLINPSTQSLLQSQNGTFVQNSQNSLNNFNPLQGLLSNPVLQGPHINRPQQQNITSDWPQAQNILPNQLSNISPQNVATQNVSSQNIAMENTPIHNVTAQNMVTQNIAMQNQTQPNANIADELAATIATQILLASNTTMQSLSIQNLQTQNKDTNEVPETQNIIAREAAIAQNTTTPNTAKQNSPTQNIAMQNLPTQNIPTQNIAIQNITQNIETPKIFIPNWGVANMAGVLPLRQTNINQPSLTIDGTLLAQNFHGIVLKQDQPMNQFVTGPQPGPFMVNPVSCVNTPTILMNPQSSIVANQALLCGSVLQIIQPTDDSNRTQPKLEDSTGSKTQQTPVEGTSNTSGTVDENGDTKALSNSVLKTAGNIDLLQVVPVENLFKMIPKKYTHNISYKNFLDFLDWKTLPLSPSYLVKDRPVDFNYVLCTGPGQGWRLKGHLVVSDQQKPPPKAAIWALRPRVRLDLPTAEDGKAAPHVTFQEKLYQKVLDSPLTYAMMLVAVESAAACQRLLNRGAALQFYCLGNGRLHPILSQRLDSGSFILQGEADIESPLAELTRRLHPKPPTPTNKPATPTAPILSAMISAAPRQLPRQQVVATAPILSALISADRRPVTNTLTITVSDSESDLTPPMSPISIDSGSAVQSETGSLTDPVPSTSKLTPSESERPKLKPESEKVTSMPTPPVVSENSLSAESSVNSKPNSELAKSIDEKPSNSTETEKTSKWAKLHLGRIKKAIKVTDLIASTPSLKNPIIKRRFTKLPPGMKSLTKLQVERTSPSETTGSLSVPTKSDAQINTSIPTKLTAQRMTKRPKFKPRILQKETKPQEENAPASLQNKSTRIPAKRFRPSLRRQQSKLARKHVTSKLPAVNLASPNPPSKLSLNPDESCDRKPLQNPQSDIPTTKSFRPSILKRKVPELTTPKLEPIEPPTPSVSPGSQQFDWDALSEADFVAHYRLPKRRVRTLAHELAPHIQEHCIKKVLSCLRYLATDAARPLAGAAQVIDALNHQSFYNKYITFPMEKEQREKIKKRFKQLYKFSNVLGVVDGVHIELRDWPPGHEGVFLNRAGFHSLNVQLICDADLNILSVDSSQGGCTHDCTAWTAHHLHHHLQRLQDGYLLGDSGYLQRETLMTPFPSPSSRAQTLYNSLHHRAWNSIKQTLHTIRLRWRRLTTPLQESKARNIINACVILHNIAQECNAPIPYTDLKEQKQRDELLEEQQEGAVESLVTAPDRGRVLREWERGAR
ncbi:uncharacterized protein LOC125238584 [Leguminivora glycinivorella]|uniref:uncharacterized protein LOC125238584 n=1 Tax=Leguminivora glycinivorella TaxID=1035111 RepID=UPI00200E8FC2|nr:uncharacterized protein LOC125238584 [Leguminivora glycinivorella]